MGEKWPQNSSTYGIGVIFFFFAIFWAFFTAFRAEGHFQFFGQYFPIFGFRPVFHSIPGGLIARLQINFCFCNGCSQKRGNFWKAFRVDSRISGIGTLEGPPSLQREGTLLFRALPDLRHPQCAGRDAFFLDKLQSFIFHKYEGKNPRANSKKGTVGAMQFTANRLCQEDALENLTKLEESFCSPLLSGLPNANTKSQRFSYAISQIAPLPPVVALNRSFKSQIASRYAAFLHAAPQIALASFLWCLQIAAS